ncbi:periplasmic protein [Luteitalea pratensis]|uniref:Periplasmic protein n=2 Tax=Luteitalea pratensis TaxID=1855912 RepID=A0A143PJT4_LUTPR|nr:periplasmic protein [Luteitalea pratensis]
MRSMMIGTGLVMATMLVTGCEHTREGVEKDAENAAVRSEQAAEKTAEATREAGRDVAQAADRAGDATREAADKTAEATREAAGTAANATRDAAASAANTGDAAQQTLQIKTALMADASIDASRIDVDTEASTKTVTLKGLVRSTAEKATATRIASEKAPGYRISNNLEVRR